MCRLLFELFGETVEGLSGLGKRCFGQVGLLLQFIPKPLDVVSALVGDGTGIAPRAFTEHTGAQIHQRHAFFRTLMAIRQADA